MQKQITWKTRQSFQLNTKNSTAMKKTVNVNIGGIAFILDEDAYLSLKRYLA